MKWLKFTHTERQSDKRKQKPGLRNVRKIHVSLLLQQVKRKRNTHIIKKTTASVFF